MNTPTADVEKIARKAAHQFLHDNVETLGGHFDNISAIVCALAQVSAPLVEALILADDCLARIRNAPGTTLNPASISQQAYHAHEAVRAALTGTEISRVKEGETTTTQKGR